MVQRTRVLHYIRVERLARYKHSSLMGPFVSYKKMKLVITALDFVLLHGFVYFLLD